MVMTILTFPYFINGYFDEKGLINSGKIYSKMIFPTLFFSIITFFLLMIMFLVNELIVHQSIISYALTSLSLSAKTYQQVIMISIVFTNTVVILLAFLIFHISTALLYFSTKEKHLSTGLIKGFKTHFAD